MPDQSFHRSASLVAGLLLIILASLFSSLVPARGAAVRPPQHEHLVPEEIELVREAQELDRRIAVFVKAAERRLQAITDPAAATKQSGKDAEKWGTLPKATRAQFLSDIARILDEAIVNIDDAAERSPKSSLLTKSLRILAEASSNLLPKLIALRAATSDDGAEREALEVAIENAQTVIEAARTKLQTEAKK